MLDSVLEADDDGADTVRALSSYTLRAGVSVETLAAFDQAATTALNLSGNDLDSRIIGNAGANILRGNGGADTLFAGADTNARDTFVYAAAGDSGTTAGTFDQIYQFDPSSGVGDATSDRISLRLIDADDELAEDQAFRFVSTFSFAPDDQPEGQVRVTQSNGRATVFIDIDGDKAADMVIRVLNVAGLSEADFVL